MRRIQITHAIVLIAILLCAMAGVALAEEGVCPSAGVKITGENKQFSMMVPKSSGLGRNLVYDDIGCAIMARNEECASRQIMFDGAAIAYDHLTGAEFPAEDMYFVLGTGIKTPRGFGIAAFGDKAAAEKFSLSHGKGKVLRWHELADAPLELIHHLNP